MISRMLRAAYGSVKVLALHVQCPSFDPRQCTKNNGKMKILTDMSSILILGDRPDWATYQVQAQPDLIKKSLSPKPPK